MGQEVRRRPINAPAFNEVVRYTSTAAVIANRVVKLGTAAGTVKHTTGTSGRIVLGVALNSATGAGIPVAVMLFGITNIEASSKAVAVGAILRATSGAASTATRLGGTVRTSTVNNNQVGMALTSAAAGTGKRLISVNLRPTVSVVALA